MSAARTTAGRRETDEAPLVADRYELHELVGRGGMAVVHRGWDRRLHRPVAVKVFPADAGSAAEAARRTSETQLLASLHHPSLVTLFDAVATEDATYLVMELVDGPTLRRWLQRSVLPLEVAAAMAASLAEGLHFIHDRGIVHRDVKPANVLLAPSAIPGRPPGAKLSDFGIARLLESTRVTSTGTFVGTAHYLSPEQARGEPVGPASDVYSLGITLLEAVTGAPAFPGSPIESATARLARDPEVPASLGYGWKSLLTAMTQRNPAARPSALDVVLRAQELQQGAVEPAPTETALTARSPEPARAEPEAPQLAARERERMPEPEERFTQVLGYASPPATDATAVLPALEREPAADRPLLARLPRPALLARLPRPALLAAAVAAAVVLLLLLMVALLPRPSSSSPTPSLPVNGEPLRTHLQQLLDSVSR